MQVAVEQLQEGLIIVVALQVAASLFLDTRQLKYRQKSMLGRAEIEPIIKPGPATLLCYYLLMFGWYSIRVSTDLTGHKDLTTESSTIFWETALGALLAVLLLFFELGNSLLVDGITAASHRHSSGDRHILIVRICPLFGGGKD